ncbi:MAG TPA: transglycosylase SLT domain-containing protein [Nitratidesulfovibrio sp.]|nr:transglycosylase SLT domain-containing protein [Nitratidesulfovibrio sp.]
MTTHAATIPREAKAYRSLLVRVARVEWGMAAPVATFAAQVHQESEWNPDAVSPVGAEGLAQFMPATARWLPQVAPQTGEPMPRNPAWALRAMVAYDRWLHERASAATPCDRMAMTLSAYNGGLGWVQRDARLAASRGFDPRRWWHHTESVNAGRSRAAFAENRGYPRRILHTLESMYEAAGWGAGSCPTPQGGHS